MLETNKEGVLTTKDIEEALEQFKSGDKKKNKGRSADERYASFDYCFNYFQSFKDTGRIKDIANSENLQNSCLQLGFYLASWGMLRGSSFLLEKSVRHFAPLIELIAEYDNHIWDIDIDNYNDENINLLLKCKKDIALKLRQDKNDVSDILTTKIMLGVFGNVPAFDSYFNLGFGCYHCKEKQLNDIAKFYLDNKEVIDRHSKEMFTFNFDNGGDTKRHYTKAKIIDMIYFIEGQKKAGNKKKILESKRNI